jgi:UBX domain-containing protein 1/4
MKLNKDNVEQAMEWLLAHIDEDIPAAAQQQQQTSDNSTKPMEVDESLNTDKTESNQQNTTDESQSTSTSAVAESKEEKKEEAKSIKCEDCGKLFQSSLEVEYHATKSGHSNFAESTEEKKPLTEEEKKAQMELIEKKLALKRAEKEEQEKRDALERERKRIQSGKDMAEARRKLEEEEMKKIVEQRKREKAEEKAARDRVKAQIEADKAARREAAAGKQAQPTTPQAPKPQVNVAPTPPKDYKQTKIQIRMPDGQTLTETFDKNEQLAAVRLFVQLKTGDETGIVPFSMLTTFPRKVFTNDDYDVTLEKLGLVPSATIMVTRGAAS